MTLLPPALGPFLCWRPTVSDVVWLIQVPGLEAITLAADPRMTTAGLSAGTRDSVDGIRYGSAALNVQGDWESGVVHTHPFAGSTPAPATTLPLVQAVAEKRPLGCAVQKTPLPGASLRTLDAQVMAGDPRRVNRRLKVCGRRVSSASNTTGIAGIAAAHRFARRTVQAPFSPTVNQTPNS